MSKEIRFNELLKENNLIKGINIDVNWIINEDYKIIIDGESMRDELNQKITELKELAETLN